MDPLSRRLAALAALALLLLFSPVLGAFNRLDASGSVPALPAYLFAVWGLVILCAWALWRGSRR